MKPTGLFVLVINGDVCEPAEMTAINIIQAVIANHIC